jgi:hypothetical protein
MRPAGLQATAVSGVDRAGGSHYCPATDLIRYPACPFLYTSSPHDVV